jgi:subtilase family serine protease
MKLKGQWLVIIALSLLLSGGGAGAWAQVSGPPPDPGATHPIIYAPITGAQPSTTGPPYTPSQVRTAYGINSLPASNTGAGQKIAIVDAYGSSTITSDLAYFCSYYGLPAANLQIRYPQGTPGTSDLGWAIETNLDVEWAHALAPGATIYLVVAYDNTGTNMFGAVQYATNTLGAQVVSMSWLFSEWPSETAYDSYFNKSGTVFVASSGDNGAGAGYPAASPNVVAVGGTTLNLNANGTVSSETAWSGSGGGPSAYEARPSYQTNFGLTNLLNGYRGTPDVAMIADPNTGVYVYFTGAGNTWYEVGGTSLSAPCWAALIALTNQSRKTPLTDAHQVLYNLAGTQAKFNLSGDYRDITQGNNGGYSAGVAYDLVTGLGVPVANKIIPGLGGKKTISPIYQLLLLN